MEIKLNKNREIEYHFNPKLEDEFVDIASSMMDVMREYHDDESLCLWSLVDIFDITYEEAKNTINCPTVDFERFISDLFNHNHNDDDYRF